MDSSTNFVFEIRNILSISIINLNKPFKKMSKWGKYYF